MGIFDLFKNKKNKNNSVVEEINRYKAEIEFFLHTNGYISVKDVLAFKERFSSFYQNLLIIEKNNLLVSYSKNNNIKEVEVTAFLDIIRNLDDFVNKHNEDFIQNSMKTEKEYLDTILSAIDKNIILDEDQRRVVLTDEDYSLVIAGAGAGKTTTVAAKVKYLVDKKNINPSEILVISFTNKAVNELKERINKNLKIECPVTTFHSAGNAIIRKKSDDKLNIVDEGFLFNSVSSYFKKIIKDPAMSKNVLLFFGSYFDYDMEGKDRTSLLNYIAKSDFSTMKSALNEANYSFIDQVSKQKKTLNNEIVNSHQEVQIANFLYLNGIDYEYEPQYPYHISMSRKLYRPDFLIRQAGRKIYLEHFGVSEDGRNSSYTDEDLIRYKRSIADKIELHKSHDSKLIYSFSSYKDGRSLIEHLADMLQKEGVALNPIKYEDVYEKLVSIDENKYISKMTFLLCDFIKNFKTNGYSEDDFLRMIRTTKSERTKLFLEICRECYLDYQRELNKSASVDFQDMINDAARILKETNNLSNKLSFKYIIVDEYQDISRQRFDLTKELAKVTNAKIMAVGDDWQSIFAFSGSDLSLFTDFKDKMGYAKVLKIVKTYRNAQEVIDIAGNFVQKNEKQISKRLISPKTIKDPVIIYSYDDAPKKYNVKATEEGPLNKMGKAIELAIEDIVKRDGNDKQEILLIGRYGYDGKSLEKTGYFEYIDHGNKVRSKRFPKISMSFLTAHSSKGLGYDNVIIINAKNAVYGFPSKIEDDPVLNLVIHRQNEIEYAEERRLFYVAMTRTKNRVYFIVPQSKPSEFVLEINKDYKNILLHGDLLPTEASLITNKLCPCCGYPLQRRFSKTTNSNLWICTNESEICGFFSNNLLGGEMAVTKCPKCVDGYLIVKTKNDFPFLGCTNYKINNKGCNHTISKNEYPTTNKTALPNMMKNINYESKNNIFDAFNTKTEVLAGVDKNFTTDKKDVIKTMGVNELKINKDKDLKEMLKNYRMKKSKEKRVPPYIIFDNKVLDLIVLNKPQNMNDFLKIKGLGQKKFETYGDDIINIIRKT